MAPTDPPSEIPDNVYDITGPRREAAQTSPPGGWSDPRTGSAFDQQTARAVAHIVRRIRPAWTQVEIMAALEDCSDLPLSEVVHAAVNLATDLRVQHPSRLPHAGPHWSRTTDEVLRNQETAAALTRARQVTGHRSHSPVFLTARCRAYLSQCRARGQDPDEPTLARYAAQGVDVEQVRTEVYRA